MVGDPKYKWLGGAVGPPRADQEVVDEAVSEAVSEAALAGGPEDTEAGVDGSMGSIWCGF